MKLYIKQKVFTYKDKFEVRNAAFVPEYFVKGKIFALSKRFNIEDSKGKKLAMIKKKIFTFLPKYKITIDKDTYVLKRKFTFFRQKYKLSPLSWELSGDFLNHNYDVLNGNQKIMSMRKHWFKWGDSYELDIPNKSNALLSLCIAIAIDAELARDKNMVRDNNTSNTQ